MALQRVVEKDQASSKCPLLSNLDLYSELSHLVIPDKYLKEVLCPHFDRDVDESLYV